MDFNELSRKDPADIAKLSLDELKAFEPAELLKLTPERLNAVIQARVAQAVLKATARPDHILVRWRKAIWRYCALLVRKKPKDDVSKKLEDFDFHELSAGIANSITDQLYRAYMPSVAARYAKEVTTERNAIRNMENDLDVFPIVEAIRRNVHKGLTDTVAKSISYRVLQEFEEQYHPQPGSTVKLLDDTLKFLRMIMVPAYVFSAIVLVSVMALTIFKSFDLGANVAAYILEGTQSFADRNAEGQPIAHVTAATGDDAAAQAQDEKFNKLIGGTLKVADLLLIGTLLVMVIIGGFENTVGRVGMSHDAPTWFGKLGIAELKIRVAASIVIISSVHLLMTFMSLDFHEPLDNDQLKSVAAITIIHAVFVTSALVLAYITRLTEPHQRTLAERFAIAEREEKEKKKET